MVAAVTTMTIPFFGMIGSHASKKVQKWK